MDAHVNLTGMAVVGLSALLCGMLMARFKQPALVGYIIAGVLLGPSAFGVVEDRDQIGGLAELGVLLLLFLIGTELSVRFFMVTWKMAMGAVALQVVGSLAAIFLCSVFLGFTAAESVLLGFVIALSSTAVAIKILEEIGQLRTRTGRIAVAILIGQDLAFLPMLIIVENIGGGMLGFWAIVQIAISVLMLVLLVQKLNKRRVDLPFARIVMGNVDLSPLAGLVYCFGFGAVFGLFGLSPAYGAFLAGLVIGRSRQREPLVQAVRLRLEHGRCALPLSACRGRTQSRLQGPRTDVGRAPRGAAFGNNGAIVGQYALFSAGRHSITRKAALSIHSLHM